MIKRFSTTFFLIISISQAIFAQSQNWVKESIDLTINTKFSQAETLLTNRIQNGDSSLAVHFYYASVLNSKMTHFENTEENQSFYDALQFVINKGEAKLERKDLQEKQKAKTEFYVGSAYGYLAFYQGQIGEWLSAVKNGSRSADYLEQAIETDSTIWDAYLGLGAYKYWLSTKIDWIPFIPDQREEGIALIRKTIEHDSYSKYLAMHQLIYILLDFGEFDQAEELTINIIEEYPQSVFMRWAHSHVFMKKKDFPKAIASYKALLELIDFDPQANPNHKITCLGRLADMYSRADSCDQAIKVVQDLNSTNNNKLVDQNEEVQRLLREVSERCGEKDLNN
ncbi:MAG: hypothetical protein D8M58_14895 [Calditrichaeota bacterium]|nr:MAG: hypothetical protein DWQ03_16135 [Calditrichota bacterium]MBL1206690.1 hypothetical protein [Calditrichota bacterium]NOG46517.1 hypothetical protein [Calditrichota bacterium]